MRQVLIEKWKRYDYVDSIGNKIWLDRYGDVTKIEDENGRSIAIGRKNNDGTLGAGLVFMPYITMSETSPSIVQNVINAANSINKYSRRAMANCIVCSADVTDFINEYGIENIGKFLPIGVKVEDIIKNIEPE